MDEKKIYLLYALLERAEREQDAETAAALRWVPRRTNPPPAAATSWRALPRGRAYAPCRAFQSLRPSWPAGGWALHPR